MRPTIDRDVHIATSSATLVGSLVLPETATGCVIFAHGSGSSRFSPRNRQVAQALQEAGLGTLLLDLLTPLEEQAEALTGHMRFDIDLLTRRLIGAANWLQEAAPRDLNLGYFGASTGAAAALLAASRQPHIHAVVSRGGRPDLAGDALPSVAAPTLLIVGGADAVVLDLNRQALALLTCEKKLEIVAGATHLFEEPGALDQVARLARAWFVRYLSPDAAKGMPAAM